MIFLNLGGMSGSVVTKDKIPTIAARKLGFSSAGAKISETINKAVDLLETQKVVTVTNGSVSFAS